MILGWTEVAVALTGHLLAFSRQQVVKPAVFDVNNLVAEVEKWFRRLFGESIERARPALTKLSIVKMARRQLERAA